MLNTQEQAALLSAAHALGSGDGKLSFSVNGRDEVLGGAPHFSPGAAEIEAGYAVTNASGRALWRTLAVTGSPRRAPGAVSAGYSIDKNFYGLDGKTLDPAHMRQNDRVIVELHGFVTGDDNSHRTVVVDMLPAGWEIEAPVTDEKEYGFLGPLSRTRVREARDDRFVAAMDFGSDLAGWRRGVEEEDDSKVHLQDSEFRVAYVARTAARVVDVGRK